MVRFFTCELSSCLNCSRTGKTRSPNTSYKEDHSQLTMAAAMELRSTRRLKGQARRTRGLKRSERSLPQHCHIGVLPLRGHHCTLQLPLFLHLFPIFCTIHFTSPYHITLFFIFSNFTCDFALTLTLSRMHVRTHAWTNRTAKATGW